MNNLKIAIIGFGNAARAFCKILINKDKDIRQNYQLAPIITAVATNTRGNLVLESGLNLEQIVNMNNFFNHPNYSNLSTNEIIEKTNYDVMIELTPLNIESGQPAISYITKAMKRHKHVITANKGPLAHAYKNLKQLSEDMNVHFLYETTVMDGTPIFNLVEDTLPYCKVLGFEGILNTTTNYILTEMEKGLSKEKALENGRSLGFVEANPRNDLEGHDAAAKVAVLANVLMNQTIKPKDVLTEGIENISLEDVQKVSKANNKLKLLCKANITNNEFKAEVKLQELPNNHPLATIKGTSSALTLKTDLMKDITIIENDPEINQTGFGIFSDLIRLIKSIQES
ncbi:MAG: hypothetical protein ACLFPS_04655 [Clostridia bacterium]